MDNGHPSFVSLFAGAGGLDLGLVQSGWTCAYASDIDAAAVSTLVRNRGFAMAGGKRKTMSDAFIERADIRTLTARDVLAKAGARRGSLQLLAGGPPCQSWSSAGHQHGFADPRGQLFEDFVRLAGGLDVRWLLLENVRGLLTARGPDGRPGSALAHIRQRLLKAGFQTVVSLLNAADYGVPQRRVRLFLLGFRAGDPPPFPAATHAKTVDLLAAAGRLPWVTLGEALRGLGPLSPDEVIRPNPTLAAQLEAVRPGQGVKSPGKREATRPGGHWGYKQGAFVADLEQPARTVTANAQQDWIKDPALGLRRLCPRECAALQTFPAGWVFEGTRVAQYRQAGNAVPPLLAQAIGTRLLRHCRRQGSAPSNGLDTDVLLPLPPQLLAHIDYTVRDERANGEARRAAPSRRVSRIAQREAGAP